MNKNLMDKDITYYAKEQRYTTKVYDPNQKISAENIKKVKDLLRYAPSSVNSQPWHFILASSDNAKAKIAKATAGPYVFNTEKVTKASHVVVFCCKTDIDDAYLEAILNQEEEDGRFKADPEQFKADMHNGRSSAVAGHKANGDFKQWVDKQVYLNSGFFLLGVSALNIDATPMEGFDPEILDRELGLTEQGYRSLLLIPIGYHDSEQDYNANLKKSRLPEPKVITEI